MQALEGRFVAQQIKGDREYQEDDFGLLDKSEAVFDSSLGDKSLHEKENVLMVIADGMGGHNGGGIASGIVTRSFIEHYERSDKIISERLQDSLFSANVSLEKAIDNNKNLSGMGTTLVAVVVNQQGLQWISVGDSQLWLFRDNELIRLNEDHSMAPVLDDLVATGRLSEDAKEKDGRKNSLRSALMGEEISLVDTSSTPMVLSSSDAVLLASDGLEVLSEKELVKILNKNLAKGLDKCVHSLIEAVEGKKKKGQDNCTILLYQPPPTPDEEKMQKRPNIWQMLKSEFNKLGQR